MTATKKLVCILAAGAAFALAAPAFADSGRDRAHDHGRDQRGYSSHRAYGDYGNYGRSFHRGPVRRYDRQRIVVVQRPIMIARPAYYAQPAPMPVVYQIGPGAFLGAVIGGYIDHRRY